MNLDLYELLSKIKQRPSLYLGKRSLSHLHVFLDGYTFACRQLGIPPTEQEKKFEEFQEWIEIRFNQESTQSWSRIILFYSEDETAALDRFFELFEEFLSSHDGSRNNDEANKSASAVSKFHLAKLFGVGDEGGWGEGEGGLIVCWIW